MRREVFQAGHLEKDGLCNHGIFERHEKPQRTLTIPAVFTLTNLAIALQLTSAAHFDVSRILETWKFPLPNLPLNLWTGALAVAMRQVERLERSEAVERFERLERTDPHD